MSYRYPTGYVRQHLLASARAVVRWDARTEDGAPRWLVAWLLRALDDVDDPGSLGPVYAAGAVVAAYEARGELATRSSIEALRQACAPYPAAGPLLGARVRVRQLPPGTWAARIMGREGVVTRHEPPHLLVQGEAMDEAAWWLVEAQVDVLEQASGPGSES